MDGGHAVGGAQVNVPGCAGVEAMSGNNKTGFGGPPLEIFKLNVRIPLKQTGRTMVIVQTLLKVFAQILKGFEDNSSQNFPKTRVFGLRHFSRFGEIPGVWLFLTRKFWAASELN